MEVEGKVIFDLGERGGTSKAGNPWKIHEYVLETKDSFPKKIAFDFFGDKADQYKLKPGDDIILSFDIESREYQGRWYTSIRGWKAEQASGAPVGAAPAMDAPAAFGGGAPLPPAGPADNSEDLPF